jgi:hypothetical protein
MKGNEVYKILSRHGVTSLFHANTVTTSCSFLKLGGLASRACLVEKGMSQTDQISDDGDKEFGVWNDIFTDGVDIHERGTIRNIYGPVLFQLPLDILNNLPSSSEVMVTRRNPLYWANIPLEADRYYITEEDLDKGYHFGDFEKHIIIRKKNGLLKFNTPEISILLDDPKGTNSNGKVVYKEAIEKLNKAAQVGNVKIKISKRICISGCRCLSNKHKDRYTKSILDSAF